MKIKEISYLDPLVDLENDCLDVFVTLENDDYYVIEVSTPKFFYTLMKNLKVILCHLVIRILSFRN